MTIAVETRVHPLVTSRPFSGLLNLISNGDARMTKTAALEYAKIGIRVNAVLPGPVNTPLIKRVHAENPDIAASMAQIVPLGRAGEAKEIADAVLFLSSDKATYITGHSLVVDGGMTV